MTEAEDLRRLERRLARERAARVEAETIAERVTADQFAAVNELMASRAVLEETPDFVAITDQHGRASYLNRALRELLGVTPDAAADVTLPDLLSEVSRERYEADALPTLEDKGVWRGEFALRRPVGGDVPVSQVLIGHRDEAGALRHISFVARDVTEQRDLTEMLAHRSLHDALTGLPNRRLLYERLDLALARSTASGPLAVLFLDLDGFKGVNDQHGHEVGDELLIAVAERLGALMRGHDVLARVGGDEFLVLCEDVGGVEGAEDVGRRLLAALEDPFPLSVGEVSVGLSVGVACSTGVTGGPAELVRRADVAMYDAKRAGKGRLRTAQDPSG